MQPSGRNRTVLIVGGVILLLCLCVCVVVGAFAAVSGGGIAALFGALGQPNAVGTQFLDALK